MERLLCVLIGYVFGLFQTGYIYGKLQKIDIRKHGSGNAGTTNVLRTLGWKAGAITFLGDSLKCILAILLVRYIFKDSDNVALWSIYAGLGAVLGHNFPFYLKFKGGKGIAATTGLILAFHPVLFAIVAGVFLIIFLITRYVSLGSIVIMLVFVAEVIIYGQMGGFGMSGFYLYELYAVTVFLALLAIFQHRANIKRLLSGTENKIDFSAIGKKK